MTWISVQDALPVEDMVLVYAPKWHWYKHVFEAVHILKRRNDGHGKWSRHNQRDLEPYITHWMPLPLPPGEEGERKVETYKPKGEVSNG